MNKQAREIYDDYLDDLDDNETLKEFEDNCLETFAPQYSFYPSELNKLIEQTIVFTLSHKRRWPRTYLMTSSSDMATYSLT